MPPRRVATPVGADANRGRPRVGAALQVNSVGAVSDRDYGIHPTIACDVTRNRRRRRLPQLGSWARRLGLWTHVHILAYALAQNLHKSWKIFLGGPTERNR